MFKIYNDIKDDNQNVIQGLTKLFIEDVDDAGTLLNYLHGPLIVPERSGTLLIVDDWLIPQLDKVQFIDGVLSVKDGEELIPPVKTEKELQREALLKQLAELDSQPDEEVNVDG